jgi:membrane-bound lytic murein transglycosylase B
MLSIIFLLSLSSRVSAQALTVEQKLQLQSELSQVEAEQKKAEKELIDAQNQTSSLKRDIAILDAKIKAATLDIKAKNLLIQTLGNDINDKQKRIADLEAHISRGKETLAQLIRKTGEMDSYSWPEVILAQENISGFFTDVDTFQSVQQGLKDTFEELRAIEASTTAEKEALDKRRNAEMDARYAIQQEQKSIQADEATKQQLLSISKGNEKAYASLIEQKKARAATIRAQLFALRDAASIPFGQALQYANIAAQKTGVRPAFLLAIMMQESSLGKNVGQCYVTNTSTGSGVNARTGNSISNVMHPTRDVPAFSDILSQIGGEVTKTVVSCPLSIGWGGAMGPAQFIPSTWVLMKNRVASAVGISGMPDPWNPSHAFMASSMYLADLGAGARTYSSERNAACKYYSGRACGLVKGNTTYGNQVVSQADIIQRTMIDPLQGI